MDFKLVSKNNMGIVATLILVILLSQSRFFDFLIVTALGRAILILFILGISYTNKILGVVSVLIIIIMFNQSDISYLEGFTSTNPKTDEKKDDKMTNTTQNVKDDKKQQSTTTTTTSSAVAAIPTTTSNMSSGREGFNMIDREGAMLRGKRSNEIPVFSNTRNQSDDIEPTDTSVFVSTFSTF
jgi:hypothetical protein